MTCVGAVVGWGWCGGGWSPLAPRHTPRHTGYWAAGPGHGRPGWWSGCRITGCIFYPPCSSREGDVSLQFATQAQQPTFANLTFKV